MVANSFSCPQAVSVGAVCGSGSAVRAVPQEHERRDAEAVHPISLCTEVTHPLGNSPHLPDRASWQGVVEIAVLIEGRHCGTAGSGYLIISLLTPAFI